MTTSHTFLFCVLFLAFCIGGLSIANAQNCEYDGPPRSTTDDLFVQGRTLCNENGPPTMRVTLSWADATSFGASVKDAAENELFSVEDRPYADNVISVEGVTPGEEYTLDTIVRNCFGEATKQFTVQAPNIEPPPSSFAVEMTRCNDTEPIFNVNVESMFGDGYVETKVDVCIGSSFEDCDVYSVQNIASTEEASFDFPGEYDTDFYVMATAVTCQDTTIGYFNYSIETPTGPRTTNESTIEDRSGLSNQCSAFLDLRTNNIEPPSWSSSAGTWTYCYTNTNTNEELCEEYSSRAFIEGLEFSTEYSVTVTLYDECSDSSASVTETFTTHEKNTESLTDTGFLDGNPKLSDQDFDLCSGNIEFSWSSVNYAETSGEFDARFDLCIEDTESNNGNCDIFDGSVYNTRSFETNITLGSRVSVSVTPNNCGEFEAEAFERSFTIEPSNVPIPSTSDFSFSDRLTDYNSSETCTNVIAVEWPVFLNNPTKGYSICIEKEESNCTPENYERTMETSFSKELNSVGSHFISVKAENCRGESTTPLTEYHNVPTIDKPTLNEAPFSADKLEPQISVTPSCDDPRIAEISYRGWTGYIDHYEICIDDSDCVVSTESSVQHTFPSVNQEFKITVSAGNCKGKEPLERTYYLGDEVVPQDEDAFILPEASVDEFCNYRFTARLEDFVNIQSFNYCVSTDACEFEESTTDRQILQTIPSGEYDINVSGFACGNQGATLKDHINLYPITEPQFTQDLSTSIEVSDDGSCSELFLTVSWPGVVDQEKWFTGSYALCVSTGECVSTSYNNVAGTSNTVTVIAGETYNVSVRASNCAGMTTKDTQITIPTPKKPSIEDAYIYYSLSSGSGGCRKTPEFYWHDFAGRYRYCFARKDKFDSQCENPSSWDSIGSNSYSPSSISIDGVNSTYVFGLVGQNCVGLSEQAIVEVFLSEATLENTQIDMSNAFLNLNQVSVISDGNCAISIEVEGGGIQQYGESFTGVYQFCIGSSDGECDIVDTISSNQGSVTIDPLPEEHNNQEVFLSMWGSGCVQNETPEKITKSFTVSPAPADNSIDVVVSVTPGCNSTRNIVASWGEIKFTKSAIRASLRDANGDEIESSGDLGTSATGYTFIQTQVATDEVYSVILSLEDCVIPNTHESEPFTVPSATAIDVSNAAVKVETHSDSDCKVSLSAEASGFENVSPSAEMKYCVGRSQGRCATSVGYSSSNEFDINKYLLDQTYHATAQVSNCPDSVASTHETALAPIPDVISTSNAKVEVSVGQFRYCGARFSVAASGFSVGGARYAGKFMYCVGSSKDTCDVVAWLESNTPQWTIDIPVVESREYYVTVYGYNCLGNSAKVSSSVVTFSNYGCCLSPLNAESASLSLNEASCSAEGNPTPVMSLHEVEGSVSKLEACVGSSQGACDIQPFQATASAKKERFSLSLDPIDSTNDVWISVRASNCRSSLNPVSAQVSGRPFSSEKISLTIADDCSLKGSVPTINKASSYRFCVGSSEGDCDVLAYRSIDAGQEFSISSQDLGESSRTFYVQAIASNCYGDSSPIRGTVTIEGECAGSGSVSGVAAVAPSLFLMMIGAVLFLVFV